jgi:NAD(P)-dependent dehydrogenase (short-subunit alcohol dehydrogenase family)
MPAIKSFRNLTAIITGASSGMGRELALQLASEGCNLALCDVQLEELNVTKRMVEEIESNVQVTTHFCDVSNAESIATFRREVEEVHINGWHLLFNNAGIAGMGQFLEMSKSRFNKVFDVNFVGVVTCTRQFLPMIVKQKMGYVINTSSINGFWSALGPATFPFSSPPHAPYSAAKAAIRGFTDSLLHDSYQNFPHIGIACVHPGHIGTSIGKMEYEAGGPTDKQINEWKDKLKRLNNHLDLDSLSVEELQQAIANEFKTKAPTSASAAASIILNGIKNGETRILVGEDAIVVDWLARMFPRLIYNDYFFTAVFFPWILGARLVGGPIGRFLYPLIVLLLGYWGGKTIRSRL